MIQDKDFSKIENLSTDPTEKLSPSALSILKEDEERNNREKNHFHWVKIALLWALAIGAVVIAGVVVLHLVLPSSCRWLTTEEVANLKGSIAPEPRNNEVRHPKQGVSNLFLCPKFPSGRLFCLNF